MEVIFWSSEAHTNKVFNRYLGPYKVAYWLRKHNHTCQVIDFITHWTREELYAITKKFITSETKIIAISTTFLCTTRYKWTNGTRPRMPERAIWALTELKKEYPHLKIIVGGYVSNRIPSFNVIDATVMTYKGAPEDVFLEYLEHFTHGTPLPLGELEFRITDAGPGHEKPMMTYHTARNPKYSIEVDDFKFSKQDFILPGEALPLDVSRGCIFSCKFCQFPHLGKGKLDYIRGMEFLKEEIIHNYENFGTTAYYIADDTFNDTEWKMSEFLKMTQSLPFKITFTAYLRADLIHRFPDTAHMLKEAGLFGAYHGIETLHPEASKIIGKAWSGKHAKEFIPELYHNIWKKEVPMHTNFIVGLPKETRHSVMQTLKWYYANNLHSIRFVALGIYKAGNDNTTYSVSSEFDRNSEKYGFTFEEGVKGIYGNRGWKNENWTELEAMKTSSQLNRILDKDKVAAHVWLNPGLMFLGWSKERILENRSERIGLTEAYEQTNEKYRLYYNTVINS
jgi:hypothetical protein